MVIGILIVTCVFCFVMGILILVGKGDFMIKCFKKHGAEKYNVGRVRLLNAIAMFVATAFGVSIHFVQAARNGGKIVWILVAVLLVVTGALQILERTWAKRS